MKLGPQLGALAGQLAEAQEWWRSESSQATRQLMRPNLQRAPQRLRPLLEPLIAAASVWLLSCLGGIMLSSFLVFAIAAALIYAIVTYVFGIDLDLALPTP